VTIVADIPDLPGRRTLDMIPQWQFAIVGANIRTLRQRKGWTRARFGELMGWKSTSTVSAVEGRRNGRQHGFTTEEVKQLAAIFSVLPSLLTTRCANCGGYPPTGFARLACGAALDGDRSATSVATEALTHPVPHDHAEARR
jgi:transcriptional regulator with XRE-family HTH domain